YVVLAPSRVPRRRRWRPAGGPPQDDRRAGEAVAQPRPEHAAEPDRRVRHLRWHRRGPAQALPQPSAAVGADRGAAVLDRRLIDRSDPDGRRPAEWRAVAFPRGIAAVTR